MKKYLLLEKNDREDILNKNRYLQWCREKKIPYIVIKKNEVDEYTLHFDYTSHPTREITGILKREDYNIRENLFGILELTDFFEKERYHSISCTSCTVMDLDLQDAELFAEGIWRIYMPFFKEAEALQLKLSEAPYKKKTH